jgi:hypothetical protein
VRVNHRAGFGRHLLAGIEVEAKKLHVRPHNLVLGRVVGGDDIETELADRNGDR